MADLLRVPELAERLGVSRSRVYQMIARKQLPTTRIGGAICIPREAWDKWMAQHAAEALDATEEANASA